jgi:cold shock CspA family protein
MEPIDAALDKFKALVNEVSESAYWKSIKSEEDTRMKIINRVFVDVLGWTIPDIHLESAAGRLFIDYRLTISDRSRLIVEAKKEARDLGIAAEHAARFFKLNGPVFGTEAAKEGIEQAVRYCGHRNAELACVTNGRQWAIFRGARGGDGTDTLDGQACVFGSLESVANKFSEFYELLSYESIAAYTYRAIFRETEGQPIRLKSTKIAARVPDSRLMLPADRLSQDMDKIMQSFFRDFSGDADAEARRACFVVTNESTAAERGLARISEELRDRVRSLNTADTTELTEAIRRVQEMKKHELVLLVGTKGAGKTTFIDRFFAEVLPKKIRDDCVVVRIDLSTSGSNANTINAWLDEHFLEVAEAAAFQHGPPTYDELQGMFFTEYRRWSEGHAKHLYESNKTQFKIEFGQHIERCRRDRPHDYITHLLFRIVQAHSKVPCLIFDNADHFDVPFQEEVFKYAHSLYLSSLCLVIVPITDTTSWQLAKRGPIQSFFTDSFFLATPATELVLRRRIEYIEDKVSQEEPGASTSYFVSRGFQLDIGNIKAFAACLQTVFLNTGQVAEWIGRLANQDIRRCLQLTREVIASPHIKIADLLKAYLDKPTMIVDADDIKLALIRGKYDIYYPTVQSFVQNLFNLTPEIETTPLLPLRILAFLDAAFQGNADNDARYVLVDQITEYFQTMNIDARATRICLDVMLRKGLCLSYDPTSEGIAQSMKVEIAPAGHQHLQWAQRDWVYFESMAEVTPMYNHTAADTIRHCLGTPSPHLRRSAIGTLIAYILEEDRHFCLIPKHPMYAAQERLRDTVSSQMTAFTSQGSMSTSARYHRSFGRISNWNLEKGFGFVKQLSGGDDVFLHVTDVVNAPTGNAIPNGALVEFDMAKTDKGLKAAAVVVMA